MRDLHPTENLKGSLPAGIQREVSFTRCIGRCMSRRHPICWTKLSEFFSREGSLVENERNIGERFWQSMPRLWLAADSYAEPPRECPGCAARNVPVVPLKYAYRDMQKILKAGWARDTKSGIVLMLGVAEELGIGPADYVAAVEPLVVLFPLKVLPPLSASDLEGSVSECAIRPKEHPLSVPPEKDVKRRTGVPPESVWRSHEYYGLAAATKQLVIVGSAVAARVRASGLPGFRLS